MKTEIHFNPTFGHLKDFIKGTPEDFDLAGQDVKSGKVDLKSISIDGITLAVKRFSSITIWHRILFSTICRSKARRAYDNSILLIERGFSSPEPIACIDIYKKGLWRTGFYISLFTDSGPVKGLFSLPLVQSKEGMKAFAGFTYRLHRAGIFHGDYTLNSLLYGIRYSLKQYRNLSVPIPLIKNRSFRLFSNFCVQSVNPPSTRKYSSSSYALT